MIIEELAFRDRRTLSYLNEKDLLDIIEFLQNDRKQWINQFSKTHNESVEIQKENQELKKQLEEKQNPFKEIFAHLRNCGAMQYEIDEYKSQQKEFIKYLEDEKISPVKCVLNSVGDKNQDYNMFKNKLDNYEEILQKYKRIIGCDKVE